MTPSRSLLLSKQGDAFYNKQDKVSSDLLYSLFGSYLSMLKSDNLSDQDIQKDLRLCGSRVGVRLSDEFYAKHVPVTTASFFESCEMITKLGLKMYFGINSETLVTEDSNVFAFKLIDPLESDICIEAEQFGLADFFCGVVSGILSQLNISVNIEVLEDSQRELSIRISLVGYQHLVDIDIIT